MVFKSIISALGIKSNLVLVCMCLIPAGNALASFDPFFDLERNGIIEGHAEFMNSPSSTSQTLTNDVNELPLDGHDLFLDHLFTQTSPSTLQFEVTIFANLGESLFVNSSLPGDSVLFGFADLGLGGAYALDSVTFEVGTSGIFSVVSPSSTSITGNGSAGSLMNLDFVFNDPTNFDAIDTFTIDARFSAVPVPAAVWLFGSGLIGLIGVARRKA